MPDDRSNRNFPTKAPYWQDRDPAPTHGPRSTDGGSVTTPPSAGKQPMAEIDGEDDAA